MDRATVVGLVERVFDLHASGTDRDGLKAGLSVVARLMGWLEAQRLDLTRSLAQVAAFPDSDLSEATRSGLRDATKVLEQVAVVEQAPAFETVLAAGEVSSAHVEVLGRALRRLEPAEKTVLLADQAHWAQVAVRSTPGQLHKALDHEVRRLQRDGGMELFERQQRATYLRAGTRTDGMWFLEGAFDPKTGMLLANRLTAEVEHLFTDKLPDTCPSDPYARQDHLRALALASLVQGGGGKAGRPEWTAVEDRRTITTTGRPVIDLGLDVHIPDAVLADLKGKAVKHTVTIREDGTTDAPGVLDLGRTRRLANAAQRRVLRALYPTCAIPGCEVRWAYLKIHHVIAYQTGGPTNLRWLLPLCCKHHHKVHDEGWKLHLARDRTLTINLPDGTVMTTGPPTRTPT